MLKFKLFDVHTHTQFAAFEKDYKEVIDRALKNSVALVNVGTQKHTSLKAVEIAEQYSDGVYAAVGLHPIHTEDSFHDSKELGASFSNSGFTSRHEEFDYEYYKKLAENPKTVAIGECGLDYYRLEPETKQKQFKVFEAQIDLAAEVKKPLMIHCRQAFPDLINILQANSYKLKADNPGIIHFFSGSKENAAELLRLGFSFSFGGVITFPPKADQPPADTKDCDEVMKYLPMENIVLETDAPYVAPVPYRGKRNEPSYIIEVAKKIAEIKNISFEKTADITTRNALRIFKN